MYAIGNTYQERRIASEVHTEFERAHVLKRKVRKKMTKTLRLTFPEWHGGVNPNYYIGSQLLNWLAPENENHEKVEVPVAKNFDEKEVVTDGVSWKKELLEHQKAAMNILKEKNPDKVIILGGDCSVDQAPFDYLHGKYPENTGILWIDTHPDFSNPADFSHEHAMVLGNLIGGGAPDFAAIVENPFEVKDIMYAGLVAEKMETWEKEHYKEYPIKYATPEDLNDDNTKVLNWIKENDYKQLLIHWDLDVLSSKDFYSLLCNEPHSAPPEYAVGRMKLDQITKLIQEVSSITNIVGLGITEFMPWDVLRLQKSLSEIEIFK